jgi:cytochrome c553
MQRKPILMAVTLMVLSASCSNLERSRNLSNPAVSARTLAEQVCSNCHGTDGNSVSPAFPRLAGQQAAYLVSQLTNFRGHQRSDPAGSEYMWGLSRFLTDDQISGLAEYYSKQTPQRVDPRKINPALLATGKEIFEKGVPAQNVIACMPCHGPRGEGIGAFPRLAYQHADYIVKQLNVFQDNVGRPGTPMEFVAHPLTGGEKDSIAAYLQSFPD